MKKATLFLLFLFSIGTIFSQDLIITNEGDSINCRITKVESENIYFTSMSNNEIKNTLLNKNQIKKFTFNHFDKSAITKQNSIKLNSNSLKYSNFDIYFCGGYSYITAPIGSDVPSNLTSHLEELKSGSHLGGGIGIYFSENMGIGFRINQFKSSNRIEDYTLKFNDGTIGRGPLEDNIKTTLFAGSLNTRFYDKSKKNSFILNLSIGQIKYKNEASLFNVPVNIDAKTIGLLTDIGGDIYLNKNVSLLLQISYMVGALSEYKMEMGGYTQTIKYDEKNKESMNRFDLSVGLKIKTWN